MAINAKPADFLAVNMATLTRLIVHLDERGVADGQGFLAELLQVGKELPPGQAQVHQVLCGQLGGLLYASRERRHAPKGDTH